MKARTYLRSHLSRVFPTLDTPRGLIVNVPASLLSSGHGLSSATTAKLAEVAEALPPDVDVRVEGYTDERGSRAQTVRASSGLAEAVRNVIEENDKSPREIAAAGFVSNTASKLHERRCVQIVITGRGIGQGIVMARTSPVARHSAVNRGKRMLALNRMPRVTSR